MLRMEQFRALKCIGEELFSMCAIFQGRAKDVSEQLKCEDDVLHLPIFVYNYIVERIEYLLFFL